MKHLILSFLSLTFLLIFSQCQSGSEAPAAEKAVVEETVEPKVIEEGEGERIVNGTKLYVKVVGKGEPIIVVHGGPGLGHTYLAEGFGELLKDQYQLIFYDQQGTGKSSYNPDTSQISLDGMVDMIDGLRKEMGIQKLNLMGHSWGGHLAMRYGINYPQHLKKLLLLSPMSGSTKMRERDADMQAQRENKEDGDALIAIRQTEDFKKARPAAFEQMYRISFKREFFNKELVNKLQFNLPDNFIQSSAKLYQFIGAELNSFDLHDDLATIKCPVLLLYGDYESFALESRAMLKASMPQAEYVDIKKAGHFSFIEKPLEFKSAISTFMSK